MSKVDEAKEILTELGLPKAQRNERSALTLLALADIHPNDSWRDTGRPLLRIWDIMGFMRDEYGKDYAANSRETIRRHTVHQFEQARIIDRNPDDPTRPTNSGKTVYALTERAASIIRLYGTGRFSSAVINFIKDIGSLQATYHSSRARNRVPLKVAEGSAVYLSPGKHNELQVAVIEEMGPCFAPGATVLYVGDTALKHVICKAGQLAALNIPITQHDKLPDVVLYRKDKNWLYLIEAVTSHGPVDPKRHLELEKMLATCPVDRIYVSAFPDAATFRRYAAEIAWETEVWIASEPGHMIHFNGPKFLGPHKP
ncbi:restriction endonuclease [Candidatus Bipolaricaulota bacterium]|nr:restriction endonuclease [Candidatus Bipolaricaulota bacterium]